MNMFGIGTGNHSGNYKSKSIFAGNLLGMQNGALKSTQEKAERQQKAGNQIQFWENQKENLKKMECGTVEEIAKKLEMFHNYEDQITAVKQAYNNEQMSHILDEAEEQGKKNAKAAEKLEPKTPEERREEMVEEALGTEEDKGILDEMLEDAAEMLEETTENLEETTEQLQEVQEQLQEIQEQEQVEGNLPKETAESMSEQLEDQKEQIEEMAKEYREIRYLAEEEQKNKYRSLDIRV